MHRPSYFTLLLRMGTLLVLYGVLAPNVLIGQSLILRSPSQVYDLEEKLVYLTTKQHVAQAWKQPWHERFGPFNPTSLSPARDHWFRVQLANHTSEPEASSEWVIRFNLSPTSIDYFLVRGDTILQYGHTGGFAPYDYRTFKPGLRNNYGRIMLSPGAQASLYIKMRSDRYGVNPTFTPHIVSTSLFYKMQSRERFFNGIFLGVLLLMMLYNFFLYWQVRDEAFIYYSAFLLCLGGFAMYNSGYLADLLIPSIFPKYPQGVFYFKLLVYFSVLTYLLFLSKFMDLARLLPSWYRVARWIMWLGFPAALADLFLMYFTNYNYSWPDAVTVGYSWFFILYLFGICIKVYGLKEGGGKRFFIVGGVAAMATGILITAVQRMLSVDYHAIPFRITTILEVMIFSLGLAYRQWELQRQRQLSELELERVRLHDQQQAEKAAQLAKLAEMKQRFYTNLTHEFRTPLTIMLGLSEHLRSQLINRKNDLDNSYQYTDQLERIQRNGEQLLRHVTQMMDMSKLSAGALDVRRSNGELIAFCKNILTSFQPLATDKGIQLHFQSPWSHFELSFDKDKWHHILTNLLANAIKFTPEKGTVTLNLSQVVKQAQTFMCIQVRDTGIGIAAKDLPHIFQRYYQVDHTTTEQQQGSGVGLTFTQELLELLEGSVKVSSKLGMGSVFSVSIPIQEAGLIFPTKKEVLPFTQTVVEVNIGQAAIVSEEERPILLLIEDHVDLRLYLQEVLADQYHLLLAKDGVEGWEIAQRTVPDLIISDVMMPKMDGFQLAQKIKSTIATSHIPLILLTAKADEESMLQGLAKGADAYLRKPFSPKELKLRVHNLLEFRAATQAYLMKRSDTAPTPPHTPEETLLAELQHYVLDHLQEEGLGVQQLADFMHLSSSQAYRKIKALTGTSPSLFIRHLRLEKAKDLLQLSDLSIAEIAYQVGFTDPNYFSRVFQQAYGLSPTGFRER